MVLVGRFGLGKAVYESLERKPGTVGDVCWRRPEFDSKLYLVIVLNTLFSMAVTLNLWFSLSM